MNKDARNHSDEYYRRQGASLAIDLKSIARNPRGVIIWTRELVVIMKPDYSTDTRHWHELDYSPRDADAWYMHLLTGNLELARALMPVLESLPWVCFQRGLRSIKPRRISWERFQKQSRRHRQSL